MFPIEDVLAWLAVFGGMFALIILAYCAWVGIEGIRRWWNER